MVNNSLHSLNSWSLKIRLIRLIRCVLPTILMDYADESKQEFDELYIEKNKYNCYWVHFAVRPKENRRKIAFLNG